jgi:hypothetical protein
MRDEGVGPDQGGAQMKNAAVALAMVLAVTGCGGGGSPSTPTAPSTPAPTPTPVLQFGDGVTGAVVIPQSTTPASPRVGESVTVILNGYMTREQKWTGPRIELWPLPGPHQPSRAYEDLVYDGDTTQPLQKWGLMRYTALIAPLAAEWASREVEIKNRLTGVFADVAAAGGPEFSWTSAPATVASLTVRVDPADECIREGDYAACTRTWTDGSMITRVDLIFAEPDYALTDSLSMHMMGYAIGLNDWDQANSVMNSSWRGRSATFHELERNAIHMMYQHRNPGNLLPDRDPGFASSAMGSGLEIRQERRGP